MAFADHHVQSPGAHCSLGQAWLNIIAGISRFMCWYAGSCSYGKGYEVEAEEDAAILVECLLKKRREPSVRSPRSFKTAAIHLIDLEMLGGLKINELATTHQPLNALWNLWRADENIFGEHSQPVYASARGMQPII